MPFPAAYALTVNTDWKNTTQSDNYCMFFIYTISQ